MDETAMRLPIRLLPRRGGQVFKILFFLFFFCFAVFWTAMASQLLFRAPAGNEPMPGFRYLFPAFGLPFMAVGLIGLASSLLKLLPGSPYFYVGLAADGIVLRKPWKTRRFAWSALSAFDVSVRVRRGKGGTTTTYWVVALRAADADRLANERERYSRSILQIDAGDYGGSNADMTASVLVDWLNQLRADALEHPGRPAVTAIVPPDFRDRAIEMSPAAPGQAAAAVKPSRGSGVIERS